MNFPQADQLPSIVDLPDPFVFSDGSHAGTPADWAHRREELKQLIQHYEYGYLPPAPDRADVVEENYEHVESLAATIKSLRLTIGHGSREMVVHVRLTIPDGPAKLPVIVRSDLAYAGWAGSGSLSSDAVKIISSRGYAIAEFDRNEVAVDLKRRTGGVFELMPDITCGTLMAWAWGYHRVIDALLSLDCIDPKHIIVTGHSRGGKACLVAGAFDERIAMAVPNASGCGGAGCFRKLFGKAEAIQNILENFPFWFADELQQFIGKVDRLPFDQHSVKSLIAPRLLLSTEGLDDAWANPQGTHVTHAAAKKVFDFLGAPDNIGIHYRAGGHDQNLHDWTALLDFADSRAFGKSVATKFNRLPSQ
jgi:(4-O-methyl)-D-glucuronate---lignin esterase